MGFDLMLYYLLMSCSARWRAGDLLDSFAYSLPNSSGHCPGLFSPVVTLHLTFMQALP